MNPQELVDRIHNLNSNEHKILYYGPAKADELVALINEYHQVPETLIPIPETTQYAYQPAPSGSNNVLLAQSDAPPISYSSLSI